MGNACQVCEQTPGDVDYVPNKRTYTTSQVGNPANAHVFRDLPDSKPRQIDSGDAPNPNSVSPATLPALSPIVKEILSKETLKKPFHNQSVSGTKFSPFQLRNQKKRYEGQWKNGIPHGKGRAYFDNGIYFQGYFKNGVADCDDGILIYPDGTFYRGQIKNSKSNGQGTLVYRDNEMEYVGQWLNDKPHGMGKESYKDGSSYVGNFVNGQKSGSGLFKWPDGSQYKGQFLDSNMHGNGQYRLSNGQVYNGDFVRSKKHGRGRLQSPAGLYVGQFANDQKNGPGEFTFPDGRIFRGRFLGGYPQGEGTLKMNNNQVVAGVWRNGQIVSVEGNSKVVNPNGTLMMSQHSTVRTPMFDNNQHL